MIYYPNTKIIPKIHDLIKVENEILKVEDVILGKEKQNYWGVRENGIMLIGGTYGRLFDNLDKTSDIELYEQYENE